MGDNPDIKNNVMRESTLNADDELSLIDLVAVGWRYKIIVVVIAVLSTSASILYALSIGNKYSAVSTVMPISSNGSSSLSQYTGIASMAGITIPGGGESTPAQKIVAILKSRTLARKLISDLGLVEILVSDPQSINKPRTAEGIALDRFMKDVFSIKMDDKTGIINITATTPKPSLSKEIANYGVSLLEEILNAKAMTVSKKTRKILESQIADQERKVKRLQDQLTDYQRKTRILTPQGQVEQAMALYSSLIQQKIAAEIELSRLENALSSDNPKITALRTQLVAVERQIESLQGTSTSNSAISLSDTPEVLVKYQNILQELEIATRIYGGLLASFENQKLQENDDQLFVEIIDLASEPEKKSAPSRITIVAIGVILGLFLAFFVISIIEIIKKINCDPVTLAKFRSGV